MSTFIETKANQTIIDQAVAAGDYISTSNGYVSNYGSEFNLTFSGTQLYIGTGMLIQNGVKVINDAPLTVEVGTSTTGTITKKVYLKVDMSKPNEVIAVTSSSTTTLPSNDIFSLFANGVANILIGTFTLNAGGVNGTTKSIGKASLNSSEFGIERTEVAWTGKMTRNTKTSINLSKYKRIRIFCDIDNSQMFELDLVTASSRPFVATHPYQIAPTFGAVDSSSRLWMMMIGVNIAKTEFYLRDITYRDLGAGANQPLKPELYFVYKIEGIY